MPTDSDLHLACSWDVAEGEVHLSRNCKNLVLFLSTEGFSPAIVQAHTDAPLQTHAVAQHVVILRDDNVAGIEVLYATEGIELSQCRGDIGAKVFVLEQKPPVGR